MKTVVTITGIRPDFVRMSNIFKKLDNEFNHILIHSGQHFDFNLSDVFFNELNIRKPNYNLNIGSKCNNHYEFVGRLSQSIIELFKKEKISPDIVLFLGDSNSVLCSVTLKKEGYKIGHIESGMRSYDIRMQEEINRKVCDTVSDYCFVYHENYKQILLSEGKKNDQVFNVGNTITEIVTDFYHEMIRKDKKKNCIIVDIHRPENFLDRKRLQNIISLSQIASDTLKIPAYLLEFKRTLAKIEEFELSTVGIDIIPLMGFKKYMQMSYDATLIISDSGTAQEEPGILKTPTIVPRDYTERPESVVNGCSIMINVNEYNKKLFSETVKQSQSSMAFNTEWLGDGKTSGNIIDILKEIL